PAPRRTNGGRTRLPHLAIAHEHHGPARRARLVPLGAPIRSAARRSPDARAPLHGARSLEARAREPRWGVSSEPPRGAEVVERPLPTSTAPPFAMTSTLRAQRASRQQRVP